MNPYPSLIPSPLSTDQYTHTLIHTYTHVSIDQSNDSSTVCTHTHILTSLQLCSGFNLYTESVHVRVIVSNAIEKVKMHSNKAEQLLCTDIDMCSNIPLPALIPHCNQSRFTRILLLFNQLIHMF